MCIALIYCDFYIMTLGKSNKNLMIFGCTNLIAQNHCLNKFIDLCQGATIL